MTWTGVRIDELAGRGGNFRFVRAQFESVRGKVAGLHDDASLPCGDMGNQTWRGHEFNLALGGDGTKLQNWVYSNELLYIQTLHLQAGTYTRRWRKFYSNVNKIIPISKSIKTCLGAPDIKTDTWPSNLSLRTWWQWHSSILGAGNRRKAISSFAMLVIWKI